MANTDTIHTYEIEKIKTLPIGNKAGQIGYKTDYHHGGGSIGPSAFAISEENGRDSSCKWLYLYYF